MNPILFESNATSFATNGLGVLSSCIDGYVIERLNGKYEAQFQYPLTGINFSKIHEFRIFIVSVGDGEGLQPFEIFKISKPINGVITVYGQHITYRLSGIVVAPYSATGANAAIHGLVNYALTDCPFTVQTDITNDSSKYTQDIPASFRQRLGGVEGSILDVFGGEYEYDNFTVKLWAHRGSDNGVRIRYGKNMQDLLQETSIESVYTGCVVFWKDPESDTVVRSDVYYISNHESYPCERIKAIDRTLDYDSKPDVDLLNTYAESYCASGEIGITSTNLKVTMAMLWQTDEYDHVASVERVRLGDTVTCEYGDLGVSAQLRVIEKKWNFKKEKYEGFELGNARSTMASLISDAVQKETEKQTVSYFETMMSAASDLIKAGTDGYIYFSTNANGSVNEIYALDNSDPSAATNVLRINKNGIAFSNEGLNGEYSSAWTIENQLVMENITVVGLVADLIQGGVLNMGSFYGQTGEINLYDEENTLIAKMDKTGIHAYASDGSYVTMNATDGFAGYNSENEKIYWVDANEFHMKNAFAEDEITIVNKIRFIPITIYDTDEETILNDGIGIVSTL